MSKRKIILNLAISLDGYIADLDGGFDWIKGHDSKECDTKEQFSFPDFLKNIDTIVMGRSAYEDAPQGTLRAFGVKKIFVASEKPLVTSEENTEQISGDVVSKIEEYKKQDGKGVWLYGGAGLTDHFIKSDVVDEYIIGVVPIILGKGRPLFLGDNPKIELQLTENTSQEGIVVLKYTKRM